MAERTDTPNGPGHASPSRTRPTAGPSGPKVSFLRRPTAAPTGRSRTSPATGNWRVSSPSAPAAAGRWATVARSSPPATAAQPGNRRTQERRIGSMACFSSTPRADGRSVSPASSWPPLTAALIGRRSPTTSARHCALSPSRTPATAGRWVTAAGSKRPVTAVRIGSDRRPARRGHPRGLLRQCPTRMGGRQRGHHPRHKRRRRTLEEAGVGYDEEPG